MNRHAHAGDDSGAALVLALIVLMVLAIGVSALLSFADTSERTTVQLRTQAATAYNADGAVQAAINDIRKGTYNKSAGQSCFSNGSDTLVLPNFYGADSAAVQCTADPASVVPIACPSVAQCNRPGSAILTLGNIPGEDGIHITPLNSSSPFKVHGVIFSNSNINVTSGSLSTNTAVYARGACSGTIVSTPSAQCSYAAANSLGNDPNYASDAATVPAYQPMPACTTPNSVVTFNPGYYDDAAALTLMMKGNSACRHSVWWFKPGTYYFDFHNTENPLLGSGDDSWTVNDGYLVAGTPAAGAASPPVPPTIPGSCVSPVTSATAVGVQFIFGGDSQLAVKAGQAEICGTYRTTKLPIAVYGVKSGSETTTVLSGASTLKLTSVISPGTFTNAANAAAADGALATWVNAAAGTKTGTMTLGGYAPSPVIPPGSLLRSATLRVVHANTAGATTDSDTVTITPTGGAAFSVPVPTYAGSATHTDLIDLYGGGTSTLAAFVHSNGLSGAAMLYTATVKHPGTEQVDSIQLDLSYTAPAFRAEDGTISGAANCLAAKPYTGTGSGTCALLMSVNTSGNKFYIQGTTYAAKAVLDITLNNVAAQVFRFGVISRSLFVKETGSFSYNGVVIEVPDDSPGYAFGVFLNAYVCQGASTCSAAGPVRLRAKVAVIDSTPDAPIAGQRQIAVESWSDQR